MSFDFFTMLPHLFNTYFPGFALVIFIFEGTSFCVLKYASLIGSSCYLCIPFMGDSFFAVLNISFQYLFAR